MARTNMTPLSRALGDAIRQERKRAALTTRALADRLDLDHTAILRLEGGTRRVPLDQIAAILGALGTRGDERERIIQMARDVDRDTWSTSGGRSATAQLATFVRYEREAVALTEANALLIPGLLQTEPYIRAVMASGNLSSDEVESRTYYRLGRQRILQRPDPPRLTAILDEAVLVRTAAGSHALMADQLDHLIKIQDEAPVEVRIIPFSAGAIAAAASGWMLLELPSGPPVVHLDHAQAGIMMHGRRDVARFEQVRTRLLPATLDPRSSRDLIAHHADNHRGAS